MQFILAHTKKKCNKICHFSKICQKNLPFYHKMLNFFKKSFLSECFHRTNLAKCFSQNKRLTFQNVIFAEH